MSGLKGNLSSLKRVTKALQDLPRVVAQKVASAAAPTLTDATNATFAAGEDPYGNTWAPGAEGQRITLKKSGTLANALSYVAVGTIIRLRGLPSYAKYQIGKRRVAPAQGGSLPPAFKAALVESTNNVIRAELGGAS